ncbi:MAG: putative dehydrogenase, partial [Thermomicrobiales bacterium]|nr:putative dehydrogenase [Thermomicrobiales bacterium]
NVSLTGVVGRLLEPACAFAEEFGAALATTDLDELLTEPRVEAVIVCSPTDLHAEQTERALRAGKHVLCEIPLATSLAEADRLIGLSEQFRLRLMVCHTQRYAAPLVEARRMIADGEVRPRAMVSRYLLDKRVAAAAGPTTSSGITAATPSTRRCGCLEPKRSMSPRGPRLRTRDSGFPWISPSCFARRTSRW